MINTFFNSGDWRQKVGAFVSISFAFGIISAGLSPYTTALGFLAAAIASAFVFWPEFRTQLASRTPFFTAYLMSVGTYLSYIVVSSFFGNVGPEGWGIVIEFVVTLTIGLTAINYARNAKIDLLRWLVIVAFVHAGLLISVAIVQGIMNSESAGYRSHGGFNAVIFAHFLMTSAGISTLWLFERARLSERWVDFAVLLAWMLVWIYAMHLNGSRGSTLVFYPFFVGLFVISLKDGRSVIIPNATVLIIAATFLSFVFLGSDRVALGTDELSQSLGGAQNDGSVGLRIQYWQLAWEMIKERPVFGHGMRFFYDIADLPESSPLMFHKQVHNQFLDSWLKAGLPGVAFFIALHTIPFLAGLRLVQTKANTFAGLVLIWLTGAFLGFGLVDVFITSLGVITMFAFYMVCLLIIADRDLGLWKLRQEVAV